MVSSLRVNFSAAPPPCALPKVSGPGDRDFSVDGAFFAGLAEHRAHMNLQEYVLNDVDRSAPRLLPAVREVDSGISELETPIALYYSNMSSPSSDPPTPVSTASAPATAPSIPAETIEAAIVEASWPENVERFKPLTSTFMDRQNDFAMAQLAHAGNACIFIGNLPASESDADLSEQVTFAFSKLGVVHVYINRTVLATSQKPWALVQYENRTSAHQAVEQGNGWLYHGRRLRVEISQARRHLTLVYRNGVIPTCSELFGHFYTFGSIDKLHPTGYPRGMTVSFSCYGAYQLAKEAVLNNSTPFRFA